MGMTQNWKLFIDKCRGKSTSHIRSAHCWSMTHNLFTLVMIFLSAITAGGALIDAIPKFVLAVIGGCATIVSSMSSFLQAAKKSSGHEEAARHYRWLMMEMAHCETEKRYDELWNDFNKFVLKEPNVLMCFKENTVASWTMTPELTAVAKVKDSGQDIGSEVSIIVGKHPPCDDLPDDDWPGKKTYGSMEDTRVSSLSGNNNYQKIPTLELLPEK